LLAALQLRWLRSVAEADRQRLESAMETALAGLGADLDREVSRAWLAFLRPFPPSPATCEELAAVWSRWVETAPSPELVQELLLVDGAGDGALRLAQGRWVPYAGTPPVLRDEERREPGRGAPFRRMRGRHRLPVPRVRPELPGLQVAVGAPGGEVLLVVFDETFLSRELLPALVRRYLAPVLGPDLEAVVTVRATGEVVYASAPGLAGRFEWEAPLFALLPPDDLHRLGFAAGYLPPRGHGGEAGAEIWRHIHYFGALRPTLTAPGWTLAVRPAEGSLDAALARARHGNTALAFGILLLLALAALALALSARRAQETARRQLEFTAAVSHELRTPLAAIRSLADNLADGVVRDPAQARVYGAQIARQGERLSEMVEQVLALSAQEAGRRARQPVDLGALVREATAEAAAGVAGARLETEVPDDLPRPLGDPLILRRAVQNLVANALKHGGTPPLARVRVVSAPERKTVRVEVSDQGPGIPPGERERLFEPFFRGERAQERQVPGVGLGLHLVRRAAEAHGGRVEVRSADGQGSTFTLILPVQGDAAP
jgi:signal transduction histidine kinase